MFINIYIYVYKYFSPGVNFNTLKTSKSLRAAHKKL